MSSESVNWEPLLAQRYRRLLKLHGTIPHLTRPASKQPYRLHKYCNLAPTSFTAMKFFTANMTLAIAWRAELSALDELVPVIWLISMRCVGERLAVAVVMVVCNACLQN